jgi:hypothetical protein
MTFFFILAGEEVFKKSPEFSDYASFEESMRQTLVEVGGKQRQQGSQTTGNHRNPPRDLLDQGGKLMRLDYTPPQHGKELAVDLLRLQDYYRSNFFHPSMEMILDLSLCKVIRAVCKLYIPC